MTAARVVLLDIETSPNLGYVWGLWDQNVIEFESEWGILCFAWKVLGEKTTHVVSRPDFKKQYKADPDDDLMVCEELWHVLNEADVVIAHNGDKFDLRKINARLLFHGYAPPAPYQSVDTLKIARRHFAFNSNRLNDLGQTLKVGEKAPHAGFKTWRGCMNGDPKSWATMTSYNAQDVRLLEQVYLKLLPWAQGGPNMALLSERPDACPSCGEGPLVRQGFKRSKTQTYQQWSCQACGSWSRTRLAERDEPKPRFVA